MFNLGFVYFMNAANVQQIIGFSSTHLMMENENFFEIHSLGPCLEQ